MAENSKGQARRRYEFTVVLLLLHFTFIILFGVFVRYEPDQLIEEFNNATDERTPEARRAEIIREQFNDIDAYYPYFQDVNVMIFIGFGFLMTFLCRYALFDVCVNFLLSAFVIEWSILIVGFFEQLAHHGHYGTCGDILPNLHDRCIHINIYVCLEALYTTAAVLISMGAVLGLCSPLQLVLMAVPEVTLLHINQLIIVGWIGTVDTGKSMTTYTFGAFFGMAAARVLTTKAFEKAKKEAKENQGSSYSAELFAMIGTLFLWMYWPSFNGGGASGIERHRAVVNTFLAIVSSCITAYAVSAVVDHKGRFDMTHLQNSTLAGGVAIGSSCTMVVHPFGALLIGGAAGVLSVIGFKKLTPWLNARRFTDTCGVNNLHGMPGILSAVVSAIVAGSGSVERYGSYRRLYAVFGFMAPANGTIYDIHYNPGVPQDIKLADIGVEPGHSYTFVKQAGAQIAGILVTLGIALIGGTVTGVFITQKFWDQPDKSRLFDDTEFFVPTYAEGQEEETKQKDEETARKRKRGIIERVKDGVEEAQRD